MDNISSERQAEIHDTLPFFLQDHESKIFELDNLLSVLKSSALIYIHWQIVKEKLVKKDHDHRRVEI